MTLKYFGKRETTLMKFSVDFKEETLPIEVNHVTPFCRVTWGGKQKCPPPPSLPSFICNFYKGID